MIVLAEIEGRLKRVATVEDGKQLYADHLARRRKPGEPATIPAAFSYDYQRVADSLEWEGPAQYDGFSLYTEITHHKWSGIMHGGPTRIIVIDTESSTHDD